MTSVLDESTGVPRIAGTAVVLSHEIGNRIAVGLFSELYLILFNQGGLDVTANPYGESDWASGAFSLRAMVDIAVLLGDAKAVLIGGAVVPTP